MKATLASALKGISQIFLLENATTGLLILIGLSVGSWKLAIACFLSSLVSNLVAKCLRFPEESIGSGLYGFNGAIVGIALPYLFGFNLSSIITTFLAVVFSTIVMHLVSKFLRPLTSPFIGTTWIVLALNSELKFLDEVNQDSVPKFLNIQASIPRGFGQVLFQTSILSGCLILGGLFIGDKKLAICSILASIAAVATGLALPLDHTTIFVGLASYNGLLVAIAIGGFEAKKFFVAIFGSGVSTVILFYILKTNIMALTSPFVITTWAILYFDRELFIKKQENA